MLIEHSRRHFDTLKTSDFSMVLTQPDKTAKLLGRPRKGYLNCGSHVSDGESRL